jgi:hypothetical protein
MKPSHFPKIAEKYIERDRERERERECREEESSLSFSSFRGSVTITLPSG